MPFTIFYAWQMDTSSATNRWFIWNAIKDAVKLLRVEVDSGEIKAEDALPIEPGEERASDPEPDGEGIVLEWGARGETGAGLIAETIMSRIARCNVFIADLTFVATLETADGRSKRMPNSNVMIETGAASRLIGWERMVLVLNTHLGTVEQLPFDLKHRHCTVQYDLSNEDGEKSQKRKELAALIAGQIRPHLTEYLRERRRARTSIPVNQFFIGTVESEFAMAFAVAQEKNKPIFMVVYDQTKPENSRMKYGLGYMMGWEETKRLVNDNFVQLLVERKNFSVEQYLPTGEHLEECRLVVIAPNGQVLFSERAYANPSEGLKQVKGALAAWNAAQGK